MADLFVRESGRPNLRAVVFLHGVGNTGGMWQRHMAALPEYRCLAPDLPGHGRSRAQAWASRAETADRIARLIETLPEGRASVIGLSLGGSVAYELLARRPELLDHVIIDGCGAVATRLASVMKIAVAAASPIIRLPAFGRLVARALGISDPPAIADFVEQLGQVDPRSFRRAFSHAQDVQITDALLRATCPTLFVAGEKEATYLRGSNRLLAELMPHAQSWMMPGVGHGWLGPAPDVHVAMVRAWIGDWPLPAELRPETATKPAVAPIAFGSR